MSNPKPKVNIKEYIHSHPKISMLIIFIIFMIFCSIVILFITSLLKPNNSEDIIHETEDAPYIIIENEYLIDYPVTQAFGIETNFTTNILSNLKMILLNEEELTSAPNQNPDGQKYTATVLDKPYEVLTFNNTKLIYSMNLRLSDGRKYILYLYIYYGYEDKYTIMVLDRKNTEGAKSYIVTYTSPSKEYYEIISQPDKTIELPKNTITDFITGIPLNPPPSIANDWIKTLNLTNPTIVYTTLPIGT